MLGSRKDDENASCGRTIVVYTLQDVVIMSYIIERKNDEVALVCVLSIAREQLQSVSRILVMREN